MSKSGPRYGKTDLTGPRRGRVMMLVKTDIRLPRYGGREMVVDIPSRHILTDISMSVSCVFSYVHVRIFRKGNPAYPCRIIEMRLLMSDGGQRCCHIPSDTGARRAVWRMFEVTGLTSADQSCTWEQEYQAWRVTSIADHGCTWEQDTRYGQATSCPLHRVQS